MSVKTEDYFNTPLRRENVYANEETGKFTCKETPTAKYLAKKKLYPLIGKMVTYFKKSLHFIKEVEDVKVENNDVLVNFDVKSFLTNIPEEETVNDIQ
ncbi:hypothetical protein Trydic_g9892 [Trypoxylus dichotomus]